MSASVRKMLEEKCASGEVEVSSLKVRVAASAQESLGRIRAFEDTVRMLGDNPENAHLRKKLEDKIRKEKQAADEERAALAEAMARLSGYREALKLLEKDAEESSEPELRPGSELYRIREAMRLMGQPLTLAQMLETLGEQDNAGKRNSVRGSVGRYAREGKIFVQTAPNTFGLLELGHKPTLEAPVEL
jgi:hypothetical protein